MNPPKLEYPASVASDFDDFDVDKREKRLTDRKLLESDETESWEDVRTELEEFTAHVQQLRHDHSREMTRLHHKTSTLKKKLENESSLLSLEIDRVKNEREKLIKDFDHDRRAIETEMEVLKAWTVKQLRKVDVEFGVKWKELEELEKVAERLEERVKGIMEGKERVERELVELERKKCAAPIDSRGKAWIGEKKSEETIKRTKHEELMDIAVVGNKVVIDGHDGEESDVELHSCHSTWSNEDLIL